MKFTIVALQDEYIELQFFEELLHHLLVQQRNDYLEQLMKTIFVNMDKMNDVFRSQLIQRKNYSESNGHHVLVNELTDEIIIVDVKSYCIHIDCSNKNNIIFDILYQNIKNYVIMEKNL